MNTRVPWSPGTKSVRKRILSQPKREQAAENNQQRVLGMCGVQSRRPKNSEDETHGEVKVIINCEVAAGLERGRIQPVDGCHVLQRLGWYSWGNGWDGRTSRAFRAGTGAVFARNMLRHVHAGIGDTGTDMLGNCWRVARDRCEGVITTTSSGMGR